MKFGACGHPLRDREVHSEPGPSYTIEYDPKCLVCELMARDDRRRIVHVEGAGLWRDEAERRWRGREDEANGWEFLAGPMQGDAQWVIPFHEMSNSWRGEVERNARRIARCGEFTSTEFYLAHHIMPGAASREWTETIARICPPASRSTDDVGRVLRQHMSPLAISGVDADGSKTIPQAAVTDVTLPF